MHYNGTNIIILLCKKNNRRYTIQYIQKYFEIYKNNIITENTSISTLIHEANILDNEINIKKIDLVDQSEIDSMQQELSNLQEKYKIQRVQHYT